MNNQVPETSGAPQSGSADIFRALDSVGPRHSASPPETDVFGLFRLLWRNKIVIATFTLSLGIAGIAYGLLAEPRYTAEVVLLPAETRSNQSLSGALAQVGGLASLAGINFSSGSRAEPLAILQSREFAADFIEKNELLFLLFSEKWDSSRRKWRTTGDDVPDIRDAVEIFAKQVRTVTEDRKTGTIRLAIDWRDSKQAAQWANAYVDLLNESMRQRAIKNSERNIAYLTGQMNGNLQVALQQAASRLLQSELEMLMYARGKQDFALRVIDEAVPPKKRTWPKRAFVAALSVAIGLALGIVFVWVRDLVARGALRQ